MFDSVLNPSAAPRRRFGTGAAFAIAFHAWALALAVGHTGPLRSHDKAPPVDVVFAMPNPSPPPPLGNPGGSPPKAAQRTPVRRAAPNPLRPPNPDPQPAATTAPEPAAPAADEGPPGDGDSGGDGTGGKGNGGDPNGDPNGVVGGTGTGRATAPPPPSVLTLNIGDAELDQTTCEVSGKPPYPAEAIAQKIEGVVLARCMVEPSGSLSGCNVLKAPYSFDGPVRSFLATAHARPFTSRGRPARVQCNFKFSYKLAQ